MGLEDLTTDVEATYQSLPSELTLELDEEARRELTMLGTALDEEDPATLLERALHLFFQTTVDTGRLDFHLRSQYDITYDEYIAGLSYEEMAGGGAVPQPQQNEDRRYQF